MPLTILSIFLKIRIRDYTAFFLQYQFEKNILRSAAIYGFILDPIKSKLPSHLDLKYLEKLKSVPHPITSIEKTITEMIYDISKLELVQINLLILCVIDIFSSGNFQQNEYKDH